MAMKTIIVKITESYFKDKLGFRKDILLDTLQEAGIPVIISPYHLSLTVKYGTLTHDFNLSTGVLTYTWTGDVSAIVEDPPKPRNTGELMNAWRQERYELGQLLRRVKPHLTKIHGYKEFMVCLGYNSEATERQLAELKEVRIQLDAMINNLPKEKP